MSSGNGHARIPPEVIEHQYPSIATPPRRVRRRPLWLPLLLFVLTILSTLAVGAEFSRSYSQNQEAFSSEDNPFVTMVQPFLHPELLKLGIPFSFTLLTILMAHELGHYFACRIHGIDVSLPYFVPAPTLFGTFGAFIRIRSPIPNRRALFDVGLSGPVAGFVFAVPALIFAIANSKIVPAAALDPDALHFGNPPLVRLLILLFHPHTNPGFLLLHPVGRAAWVGLFVTALNLLPAWQLDGGHILYSLASAEHRRISLAVGAVILMLGHFDWPGWYLWGGLIVILSWFFRHPPLINRWEPLDANRRFWAVIALVIFLLSFTPWPTTNP
ncbi:MAG: site-2 protease family protein [Candidatus Acidiferrales bacterium]